MLDQFHYKVKHMDERLKIDINNKADSTDPYYQLKELDKKLAAANEEKKQEAKDDKGKIKPALVPPQIIRDIAVVREYGCEKYHSPDNWKKVEKERYENALLRHTLAWMDDKQSKDAESGIEHYKHMACNLAFLCEMYKDTPKKLDTSGTINTEHINVIPQAIVVADTVREDCCCECAHLYRLGIDRSIYLCRKSELKITDVAQAMKTTCNYFEEKEKCLMQQK